MASVKSSESRPPEPRTSRRVESDAVELAPHLCVLPEAGREPTDRFWAAFLGVTIARFRKLIHLHKLPHRRIGTTYLVDSHAIRDAFPIHNPSAARRTTRKRKS